MADSWIYYILLSNRHQHSAVVVTFSSNGPRTRLIPSSGSSLFSLSHSFLLLLSQPVSLFLCYLQLTVQRIIIALI